MLRSVAGACDVWRLDPALRLVLVAALLSAGKVLLYTSGTTLFLARQGIEALPALYLALAAIATLASLGLAAVIDRVASHLLLPGLACVVAIGTGGLLLASVFEWRLLPAAILVAAHVYDIVTDIVFWVLAAAFFDNLRLRRLTPRFYLAIAAGGSAAGLVAERVLATVPADALLWPVIGLCCLAALALGRCPEGGGSAGAEAASGGSAGAESSDGAGLMRPGELGRFLARHPFAFLLALNSMLLTAVYSLTEYVAYAIYAESYPDEVELGRFLALLFAALQLAEFAVLWFGARRIVERAGPVLRNLLFPVASLVCLAALVFQPRLGWAILAHLNTEAVSNGVFEPVNATNYGALPVAVHGRARTLADGIFYPIGMAFAGLMLALLPATDATFRATVLALLAAAIFVVLNFVVARAYLPTLLQQVRHGLAGRQHRHQPRPWPRCDAAQLAQLLTSRRIADRRLALDLLEADLPMQPAPPLARLLPELLAVAPRLAQADWVRLASLLADLEPTLLSRTLAEALGTGSVESVELLATAHVLADLPLDPLSDPRRSTPDRSGSFLAALSMLAADAADPPGSWAGTTPDDAAWRGRLAAVIRRAPLAVLQRLARQPTLLGDDVLRPAVLDALSRLSLDQALGALEPFLEELRHSPQPAHRAAALRCMGSKLEAAPGIAPAGKAPAAVADAAAGRRFHARLALAWPALADPSPTVRAAAIAVLLPDAERAIARIASGGRLADPSLPADRARGLIEFMAATGDRSVHRLLRQLIARLAAAAERDALLLERLAEREDPALDPLRAAVLDHAHGLTELLFAGLGALGERERASQLREALRDVDTRLRAGSIDGLVSLRNGLLARRFMPLLEQLHLPAVTGPARKRSQPVPLAALLDRLAAGGDRWPRAAVALVRERLAAGGNEPLLRAAASGATRTRQIQPKVASSMTALTDSATLDAMLRLKRFALFAELPFDVLEAVLHRIEERQATAGMVLQRAGGPLLHAWLVDTGSLVAAWSNGREERLGPDSWIGETALVDPTVAAPTLTARTACRVFRLHRVVFQDLAREHPVLTESLCRLLARSLNQQRTGSPGIGGPGSLGQGSLGQGSRDPGDLGDDSRRAAAVEPQREKAPTLALAEDRSSRG